MRKLIENILALGTPSLAGLGLLAAVEALGQAPVPVISGWIPDGGASAMLTVAVDFLIDAFTFNGRLEETFPDVKRACDWLRERPTLTAVVLGTVVLFGPAKGLASVILAWAAPPSPSFLEWPSSDDPASPWFRHPLVSWRFVATGRAWPRLWGRASELANLDDFLEDKGSKLYGVYGPRGVGATRLAVECMRRRRGWIGGWHAGLLRGDVPAGFQPRIRTLVVVETPNDVRSQEAVRRLVTSTHRKRVKVLIVGDGDFGHLWDQSAREALEERVFGWRGLTVPAPGAPGTDVDGVKFVPTRRVNDVKPVEDARGPHFLRLGPITDGPAFDRLLAGVARRARQRTSTPEGSDRARIREASAGLPRFAVRMELARLAGEPFDADMVEREGAAIQIAEAQRHLGGEGVAVVALAALCGSSPPGARVRSRVAPSVMDFEAMNTVFRHSLDQATRDRLPTTKGASEGDERRRRGIGLRALRRMQEPDRLRLLQACLQPDPDGCAAGFLQAMSSVMTLHPEGRAAVCDRLTDAADPWPFEDWDPRAGLSASRADRQHLAEFLLAECLKFEVNGTRPGQGGLSGAFHTAAAGLASRLSDDPIATRRLARRFQALEGMPAAQLELGEMLEDDHLCEDGRALAAVIGILDPSGGESATLAMRRAMGLDEVGLDQTYVPDDPRRRRTVEALRLMDAAFRAALDHKRPWPPEGLDARMKDLAAVLDDPDRGVAGLLAALWALDWLVLGRTLNTRLAAPEPDVTPRVAALLADPGTPDGAWKHGARYLAKELTGAVTGDPVLAWATAADARQPLTALPRPPAPIDGDALMAALESAKARIGSTTADGPADAAVMLLLAAGDPDREAALGAARQATAPDLFHGDRPAHVIRLALGGGEASHEALAEIFASAPDRATRVAAFLALGALGALDTLERLDLSGERAGEAPYLETRQFWRSGATTEPAGVAPPAFADAVIAGRGHLIHKLKAKDTTSRWAYYFVMVMPDREREFLRAIEGPGTLDLEDYGRVIASCYGEEPTREVVGLLKEKYGFDV